MNGQVVKTVYAPGGVSVGTATQGAAGTNEVQVISVDAAVTGGTFTLTFNGQTTAALAWNATVAQVQAALAALSTVGAGNVSVSLNGSGDWVVTFQSALGGTNVNPIRTDGSG